MDELAKEYLLSFYDRNLRTYGDSPEALRWTISGQKERYGLMLEISPNLEGSRVLDYGCGKGDFYGFLNERGIGVSYTGMDINPSLIGLATSKYPGVDFRVFDIEEQSLEGEEFDYIFLCGVFNNRVGGAEDTMMNVLSRLFRHTRVALAVNAVSSYSPTRDPDINYTSPEEMLRFSLKYMTPYVSLRHDRVAHDFTIFLYRDKTLDEGSSAK